MAVSNKQLSFYFEVCARKKVAPKDVSNLNGNQLFQLTQEVLALPTPASENQLNTLRELLTEMVDAGIAGVSMGSEKFWKAVESSMDKCSQYIDHARKIRSQNFDKLKPTEQQLERISLMYTFPEVEWESYGINLRIYEEHLQVYCSDVHTPDVLEQRRWRRATRQEFMEQLGRKLTHANASALLDRYSGAFTAWNRSRLTDSQKRQIRSLEERLATIFVPKEKTVYEIDSPFEMMNELDTNISEEVDAPFMVTSKKVDNWNPVAYVGLDEQVLDMFSREEADKYITQLRYELQNKELRNVSGAQNLDYENYGIEEARTAKNDADARTKEFKELNNFLYGLSDIAGFHFEVMDEVEIDGKKVQTVMSAETLRHEALRVFFDNQRSVKSGSTIARWTEGASNEKKEAVRSQILDFMKLTIDTKAIKFRGLIQLADKSQIASELLDELIADPEYAVKLIQQQRNNM